MAAWLAIGGQGAIESLTYHGERGLEIGSLYSGLLMARRPARRAGGTRCPFDHGSFNLVGPGSGALAKLSGLVQIAFLVGDAGSVRPGGVPLGNSVHPGGASGDDLDGEAPFAAVLYLAAPVRRRARRPGRPVRPARLTR